MNRIIIYLLLLTPFHGFAQVDWKKPRGTIKNEEIVIEKEKQIFLSPVSRRFASITLDTVSLDTTAIHYIPRKIDINLAKIKIKVRPKTMKTEGLSKTYWGNLKLGYGSYISPYLKADLASKRNDEYAVALHLSHFSSRNGPIDKNNSGLSNTDAFLNGKLFLNKMTLGAKLGSKFDMYHLYGYERTPTNSPPIVAPKQNLSNYTLGASLTDNTENNFSYILTGGINFFNAKRLNWKETDLYAHFKFNLSLSKNLHLKYLSKIHSSQSKSTLLSKNSRLYYMIKPMGTYKYDAYKFELGASIYGIKDPANFYKQKIYVIPHIIAHYNFLSGHTIFGGLKGDITWISAKNQFDKNPYLGEKTIVNNEVKPFILFAEANGKVLPKIDYSIKYKMSIYTVFGSFINNNNYLSTYSIDYITDNNSVVHYFSARLDFVTTKYLLFSLYGKYSIYVLKNIKNAYHNPNIDLGFKVKFNSNNKLYTELTCTFLNGIYAKNSTPNKNDIKLDPILDINLSSNYKINSTFSIFMKMQNILDNQYQYYYNYPSKGFQLLLGISFIF